MTRIGIRFAVQKYNKKRKYNIFFVENICYVVIFAFFHFVGAGTEKNLPY